MKTLHIIPHTHWDREWYFTCEESQVLLYQHMKDLLAFMEGCPDYPHYVLDGQTSLLEDYLEAAPEDRERITALISQGRLSVGPWYTQTDEMAVGGESISRNLYWGYRDCRRLSQSAKSAESAESIEGSPDGPCYRMPVGYLPDSFGQCAQMPMILRQADVPYSVFWRGISSRHGVRSEFIWESSDHSRVTVQQLPLCYALGRFLPADASLKKRMDMTLSLLEKSASPGCTDFVLPNGFDQMPVQKNIEEVLSLLRSWYPDWNFVLDSYENVCRLQEGRTGLPVIQGEFLDGATARVHRSIYSTRMDLKVQNTRLEESITHGAEPLGAMAWQLGFGYPAGLYEKLWKELLKNHAHDSMGACCSDEVHRIIASRYEEVRLRSAMLAKYAMRFIADHQELPPAVSQLSGERLLLFNTLPANRETTVITQVTTRHSSFALRDKDGMPVPYQLLGQEPVDASVVFREFKRRDADGNLAPFTRHTIAVKRSFPAFGYETLYLDFAADSKSPVPDTRSESPEDAGFAVEEPCIEDPFYRVRLRKDGCLDILDKGTGRLYPGLASWEDGINAGDEYDYSPPEQDRLLTEVHLLSCHAKPGPLVSQLHYQLSMPLRQGCAPLSIGCTVRLQGDGLIRFETEISNQADNHRLRLLFPTGISADCSHASQAFGEIVRPVRDPALDIWEKEKWEERPDGIYPMIDYVYLRDSEVSFGLITRGGREYEIVGESHDTIAFTVLSSIGMCGNDNLIRRPGRLSGIALPTPDSQMHGKYRQEFALSLTDASRPAESCAQASALYHWPILSWHQAEHPEFFLNKKEVRTPPQLGLFRIEGEVQVSAVKKAEEQDGFLVRVFNPCEQTKRFSFLPASDYAGSLTGPLIQAVETDLLERPLSPAEASKDGESDRLPVAYDLLPNQVRSYLVTLSLQ